MVVHADKLKTCYSDRPLAWNLLATLSPLRQSLHHPHSRTSSRLMSASQPRLQNDRLNLARRDRSKQLLIT